MSNLPTNRNTSDTANDHAADHNTVHAFHNLVDAKGDLIAGTGVDTAGKLAVGADGKVLTANSATATGLEWSDPVSGGGGSGIPASTVDAKGDLIAATANDTVTRLPVGTYGQVLTADSAEATGLKWGDVSGTGVATTVGPARPESTVITNFESGHGWTTNGTGVGTINLNDTSTFVRGTQSAKITTAGNSQTANLDKTGLSIDSTGQQITIWLKVSNKANLTDLNVFFAQTSFASFYRWTFQQADATTDWLKSNEWSRLTLHFGDATEVTAPTRNNITTLRLQVKDNGTPVDIWWNGVEMYPDPPSYPNGVVSIVMDDCFDSMFDLGKPRMDLYSFPGTTYVIADQVGQAGRLSAQELLELQDLHAWEVAGHAYVSANHDLANGFADLSASALTDELRQLKHWLVDNGFRGAEHLAWPKGQFNTAMIAAAKDYFLTARSISAKTKETFPAAHPMKLRAVSSITSFAGGVPAATVQTYIDQAYDNKGWLILCFHKLTAGAPAATTECSQTDFNTIIDYLNTKGIPVMTVGDVWRSGEIDGGGYGTGAVALRKRGDSNTASSTQSIAIGKNALASTGAEAIAIGGGVNATAAPNATAQGAIAIGASNGAAINGARAGGTSAIAIGSGDASTAAASAGGAYTIAIGYNAINTSTQDGIAIGTLSRAGTALSAVAIGRDASATGQGAIVLSGGIGSTTAATASGSNGISIGSALSGATGPRCTGAQGIAIGGGDASINGASASNSYALAVGSGATASATGSTALGKSAASTHGTSVALGAGAATTAANQIMLGTAAETVMHPGGFQLGTSTTSGYVLTANASGVGTWQVAVGGGGISIDGAGTGAVAAAHSGDTVTASSIQSIAIGKFASANTGAEAIAIGGGVSATAAPQSTGQGAIAIGASDATGVAGARASGATSVAIGSGSASGAGASASGNSALAFGSGAQASNTVSIAMGLGSVCSGQESIAIGNSPDATGSASTAVGASAQALTNYAIALGANCVAQTGTEAVAIGSGVNNTAAPNATAQGAIAVGASGGGAIAGARASGASSVAIGSGTASNVGASATGSSSVAIGRTSSATATAAVALGLGTVASGVSAIALGPVNTASADYTIAVGNGARATTSTQALAIGSGVDNTAAPFASAQGAVAIGAADSGGTGPRASGTSSLAIGSGTVAAAGASATAAQAIAIGLTSSAAHATAVALGAGATTTAANQIRLGTAAETVSVPGFANLSNYADLAEVAAPATPAANFVRLYAKADGLLYSKDDAGVETVVTGAGAGGGIPASTVDAKGDLIAATANDTVTRLAVGTNGQVLTADSAEATGLKWGTASGSGSQPAFDQGLLV